MNEQLKIIISAEVNKLKKSVDEAKSKVSSFKDEVAKASKNVDENFKNMGTSIANGAKAMGAGLAAAGTALLALGASTQEYRNEQAKLTTAFQTAGGSAAEATQTYNDLYRVLGDGGQATEAASHLAKLTTEEKALKEWTTICQGVYATFGASLPIEGLTEAANETAKVGTVTGSLADALNWAGISEDAFNEKLAKCNTEAEREKLIRQTLNGVYNDAAGKYEKNNAQVLKQNESQAKLQATTAKLGQAVAPVITAFTNFANNALAAVTPYIQNLSAKYMPALTSALTAATNGLKSAFTWVSNNKVLLATIAGVVAGITAAIGLYNTVAAVKAAMDAAQVTTLGALIKAQAAQAAGMLVAIAPYVAIVAAIAAVIAIIVLCVKHWDKIKATVINVWNSVVSATKTAVANAKAAFNDFISKISSIVTSIKQKFDSIVSTIKGKLSAAKSAVSSAVNSIKSAFNLDSIVSSVKSKFDSIVNSIKSKLNTAKNTVSSVINQIKGFFNFKWSLPKLKMPKVKITGKFSLSPLQVPKFSISWNKMGGIFDKPTLFNYGGSLQGIGEDGAEAVVPLENNLGWLNKLADMLNERMGGGTPIVLTVDGKVFAETAFSTMNAHTRQTGKLALNLV